MKVWALVVFESGDCTTSVWGVYDSLEKAQKNKEELEKDTELNDNGNYLIVDISEHTVA